MTSGYSREVPLTENQVIDAVAAHLAVAGWTIVKKLTTVEQGTDIIAERADPVRRLHVEAKGGTSSKDHTERFGLPSRSRHRGITLSLPSPWLSPCSASTTGQRSPPSSVRS